MAWTLLPMGVENSEEPDRYQNIMKYGVAFYRKECMLKMAR